MPPCNTTTCIYICARITGRYMSCAVTPQGKDTSTASSLFSCEDEEDTGVDYQWNRLNELKTRNNLCVHVPHIETTYPVKPKAGDPNGHYNENIIRHQTRTGQSGATFDDTCDFSVKVTRKSLSEYSRRESIDNRPNALRRGLTRQNGFVRRNEEPSRSSQIELNPLGNRHVLQTGL